MFWDASFDQNNVIDGKHFSEHIADIFNLSNDFATVSQPFSTLNITTEVNPIDQTST